MTGLSNYTVLDIQLDSGTSDSEVNAIHRAQMVSTMVMLWIRFMGPYTANATEKRRIRRMIPNSDQGMPHTASIPSDLSVRK